MALTLPREPKSGEPVQAETVSQLIRYVKSITPRDTPTLRWETGSGGARGYAQGAGRRGSTATPNFTLEDASADGVLKITVSPGLVDNIVPTIDSDFLVSLPAPKLTLTGENGEIWLKNTLDARGVITESIFQSGDEMPEDDEDGDFAYRLVGTFTSTDGAFTSLVSLLTTNQNHRRCNGSSTWGN
jgi:hypothetical protein